MVHQNKWTNLAENCSLNRENNAKINRKQQPWGAEIPTNNQYAPILPCFVGACLGAGAYLGWQIIGSNFDVES